MSQLEFYEAIARIAEEASLVPHSTLYEVKITIKFIKINL